MPQQESNYRTVFEKNSLPMIIIDKKTYKFLDSNPAVTSVFGYKSDELLKMTFFDIVSKEDHKDLKEQLNRAQKTKI